MTNRTCQVCGADISGKRRDAKVCGSSCRAAKSRGEQSTPRFRPRAKRSGIEVYLSVELAEGYLANETDALDEIARRIARLLDRKN